MIDALQSDGLRSDGIPAEGPALLYGNEDWSVSVEGLEHRATGYVIERATLPARRAGRLWDWPLQMAEKRWCRPSLFRDAFLVALDRFGIPRDADLTRSFALGYGIRAADAPAQDGFVPLRDLVAPRTVPAPDRAPAPRAVSRPALRGRVALA